MRLSSALAPRWAAGGQRRRMRDESGRRPLSPRDDAGAQPPVLDGSQRPPSRRQVGALAALGVALTACSPGGGAPASAGVTNSDLEVVQAATGLLDRLAGAVRTGDRALWASTVAPASPGPATSRPVPAWSAIGSPSASSPAPSPAPLAPAGDPVARLIGDFEVLSALRWVTWRYENVRLDDTPQVQVPGSTPRRWVRADLVAQIHGVDREPTVGTHRFALIRVATGWRLCSQDASPALSQPWSLPGAQVRTGDFGAVLVTAPTREVVPIPPPSTAPAGGGAADQGSSPVGTSDPAAAALAEYAEAAAQARQRLLRLWPGEPDWGLLVVAPATDSDYLALTHGIPAQLSHVAGVTDGPLDASGRAVADRIALNPQAMARLSGAGRSFVVAHEAAHARLRLLVPGRTVRWLVEGFADWVGYEESGLTASVIAQDALAHVRAHGLPDAFPDDAAFDAALTDLAATYQFSWLLVALLIEDHGLATVREFVTAATVPPSSSMAPTDAVTSAFTDVLHVTVPVVMGRWRARLSLLVGAT